MTCALCEAEKKTSWHYEDNDFWVADDLSAKGYLKRIIGVYKPHGQTPPIITLARILNQMILAAQGEGYFKYEFDSSSPTISPHWHIQLCIVGYN